MTEARPMTVLELISALRDCDGNALACVSNEFGFMTISRLSTRDDESVLDNVEHAEYLVPRIVVLE